MSTGVCTSCVVGGGTEFFEQNNTIPSILANDKIACKKEYNGCIYTAQGNIVCNLQPKSNKSIKENFVQIPAIPGMIIGGLPNIPNIPNLNGLEDNNLKNFY
jgi:hypothetical protein